VAARSNTAEPDLVDVSWNNTNRHPASRGRYRGRAGGRPAMGMVDQETETHPDPLTALVNGWRRIGVDRRAQIDVGRLARLVWWCRPGPRWRTSVDVTDSPTASRCPMATFEPATGMDRPTRAAPR
jgi:hypothetical protein